MFLPHLQHRSCLGTSEPDFSVCFFPSVWARSQDGCRRSLRSEVVEQTGEGQFYNWILRAFFKIYNFIEEFFPEQEILLERNN